MHYDITDCTVFSLFITTNYFPKTDLGTADVYCVSINKGTKRKSPLGFVNPYLNENL